MKSEDEVPVERVTQEPEPQTISTNGWAEAVAVWVDSHIRNSPVAQSTAAWNHLMASLEHLRVHVNAHLKKG